MDCLRYRYHGFYLPYPCILLNPYTILVVIPSKPGSIGIVTGQSNRDSGSVVQPKLADTPELRKSSQNLVG